MKIREIIDGLVGWDIEVDGKKDWDPEEEVEWYEVRIEGNKVRVGTKRA